MKGVLVEELFPTGAAAFMLGQPHHGTKGEVLKIDTEHKGKIQLKFTIHPGPDLSGIISRHFTESYMPGYRAAQRTDSPSKSNIGLGLKFSKRQ